MNTEIIARYDEIICHKASNHGMYQQKRDLEQKYDSKVTILQGDLDSNFYDIQQLSIKLNLLESSIDEKTTIGLKKYMQEREKINQTFDNDPHN